MLRLCGDIGMVYVNMCHSDQMPPMQDRNGRTASSTERTGNLLIPLRYHKSIHPHHHHAFRFERSFSRLINVV
jgi:hypothetical protein